jgi:hypothetical protein
MLLRSFAKRSISKHEAAPSFETRPAAAPHQDEGGEGAAAFTKLYNQDKRRKPAASMFGSVQCR